jgi:hypothetical protein
MLYNNYNDSFCEDILMYAEDDGLQVLLLSE